MNDIFRNQSGYIDTTAGKAIARILRKDKKQAESAMLEEMKNRPLVYICSKYAGNTQVNVYLAVKYCCYAIKEGKIPVASHLLYPQMLDDNDPVQRKLGCQFGLALLKHCSEVWVFNENRELSEGMRAEIKEARLLGKKVKYHDVKELKL